MPTQLDWQAIQKQMSFEELRSFKWLRREIGSAKQSVEILVEFKNAIRKSIGACEKHWIHGCYECSPVSTIDRAIRKAKKRLASLKFRMMSLPTIAKAIGRMPFSEAEKAALSSLREDEKVRMAESVPTERLFTALQRHDTTQPLRAADVDDNIRLLQAWLSGKAAGREG